MTQISIPATAVFFWGLYVTIFGHLVDFVNFGRFRQFWPISGRGRNFAILAFAKPGKWHRFLYQPQQYFSGAYMWHFSGSLDFSPISAIFASLGNLGKVFVLRSSISAIFASLGNLCFKDFDFDHFGHFRESWESWEVFVLRSSICPFLAVVETLRFWRLLNLENDTDFYTSHSSIFLGLICDHFRSSRRFRQFWPISSILADFGPWSKLCDFGVC